MLETEGKVKKSMCGKFGDLLALIYTPYYCNCTLFFPFFPFFFLPCLFVCLLFVLFVKSKTTILKIHL